MRKFRVEVEYTVTYEIYRELGDETVSAIAEEYPDYEVCGTAQMSISKECKRKMNVEITDDEEDEEISRKVLRKLYDIESNDPNRPSATLFDIEVRRTMIVKRYR